MFILLAATVTFKKKDAKKREVSLTLLLDWPEGIILKKRKKAKLVKIMILCPFYHIEEILEDLNWYFLVTRSTVPADTVIACSGDFWFSVSKDISLVFYNSQ